MSATRPKHKYVVSASLCPYGAKKAFTVRAVVMSIHGVGAMQQVYARMRDGRVAIPDWAMYGVRVTTVGDAAPEEPLGYTTSETIFDDV